MSVATAPRPAAALPVGPRAARAVLLGAAFACAACGLVYELALIALGSYLVGETVHQTAIVLSVMMFAMGMGALAAKPLQRHPALGFAAVEAGLALVGGVSVLVVYASFAWLDLYQPALVAVAFVIGALIGAEIPLLMTLVQRVRAQAAGDAAADLFAADYVGALVGGLAFPFVVLPWFGQVQGALAVAAVNVVAAGAVSWWLFRADLGYGRRRVVTAVLAAVLLLLVFAAMWSERLVVTARQVLYDDPVVTSRQTRYQEIVVTESQPLRGPHDVRLFLNGDLQLSSLDEYRYHEALVHPAMAGNRRRVLVLGGGDGAALREILRYPDVEAVVLVELDPEVTALARNDRRLRAINQGSLDDPRVEVVHSDAFRWVRDAEDERFDVVIVDFPDPETPSTAKLYSVEMYGMLRSGVLAPGGRLAVQAGSPYFAREAFWCVETTLRAGGFDTVAYAADVPTFGNWGFVLAGAQRRPALQLADPAPALRFMSPDVLSAAAVFPPDRARVSVDASTLLRPTILDYSRRGWARW